MLPVSDCYLWRFQGGHEVTLDSRALRSPAGRPLVVPTRQLALAIASEWEQQACVDALVRRGWPDDAQKGMA